MRIMPTLRPIKPRPDLERSARLIILSNPDYNWPGDNLKLRLFSAKPTIIAAVLFLLETKLFAAMKSLGWACSTITEA
jgi:hypothetical protein